MLVADKAKPPTLTSSHSSSWSVLLPKDLSEEVLAHGLPWQQRHTTGGKQGEPEDTCSFLICVGFSFLSGRGCQTGKLPHPWQLASACPLSVAKAWSAGTSRTLSILGWIARQGRHKTGDREGCLCAIGQQKEAVCFQCERGGGQSCPRIVGTQWWWSGSHSVESSSGLGRWTSKESGSRPQVIHLFLCNNLSRWEGLRA